MIKNDHSALAVIDLHFEELRLNAKGAWYSTTSTPKCVAVSRVNVDCIILTIGASSQVKFELLASSKSIFLRSVCVNLCRVVLRRIILPKALN